MHWLYSFEPTGRGIILCHRWFNGEYRGAVFFTLITPIVMACFNPRERAEWRAACELERAA